MDLQITEGTFRIATVGVTGRLDALAAPVLRAKLLDLVAAGVATIVVDLAEVDFLDSAGLATLIKAHNAAEEAHASLELVRPKSTDAFRVFRLTQFDRVFSFRDPATATAP